ncbi:MAG TPA: WD40 repeat domain-containing protein [Pyrinomonadaceae bacterium]|nr:WD40 repeat domain-containing protein [Pyrinomonadaceae bacterium]
MRKSNAVRNIHVFVPANCLVILLLSLTACQGQTGQPLSRCRPSPPLPPNAKPGANFLSLSRDGKTLVVAGGDARIRFVDMNTGAVQRTLAGHTNGIYRAVFSPDEKLLASSSRDSTARIWDVSSGRELYSLNGFHCAVKAVAFSPDGQLVAAAGNDGLLKLWEVKTGNELKSLVHTSSADVDTSVYSVAFGRDGKKIYAGNGDGSISEWDIVAGKETRVWKAHDANYLLLVFSPDYSLLASYGGGLVRLWDTTSWREVRQMSAVPVPAPFNLNSMIAFSHDGHLIAASGIGMDQKQTTYVYVQTLVWKVETGEKLFTLEGQRFDINGLTFTRDNRFLMTGSVDTTIKFWDMKTGKEARTITMPPNGKAN